MKTKIVSYLHSELDADTVHGNVAGDYDFTHFYSDPHFGHRAIIEYCCRPFRNVDEMNEELVRRYNEAVTDDSLVLWCGDVSFMKPDATEAILSRLRGRKAIVIGNHDRSAAWYIDRGFEFAKREISFTMGGQRFRACHFPEMGHTADRRGKNRPVLRQGEWLIHGHTHSGTKLSGRHVHVGVDAWEYAPASARQIIELVEAA